MKQETGSVYFRDEQGNLLIAKSYVETTTGEVTTEVTPDVG